MDAMDQNIMSQQPSNPFNRTSKPKFNSLQEMNQEAKEMLNQKQAELNAYKTTLADAHDILQQLQKDVEAKREELNRLKTDDFEQNEESLIGHDLSEIDEKFDREIEKMKKKHEEEIQALTADFQQTLQEAEEWANKHSEIALQQKMKELQELKDQAQMAKNQLNELTYSRTKKIQSTPQDEESRKSSDQISKLEHQISELTAITREEMRVARANIDECVAAIELRRRNQSAEIQRLRNEAAQRNERYASHIEALKEQFELEKATMQQNIDAINKRAENTQSLIQQLEKHHETQLYIVNNDIETMKKTLSTPMPHTKNANDFVRNSIRESQKLQIECNNINAEVRLIDNEINDLQNENEQLRKELKRLRARKVLVNY